MLRNQDDEAVKYFRYAVNYFTSVTRKNIRMKQKTNPDIHRMGQQADDGGILVEVVRKSQLAAVNEFDYRKLGRKQDGLLNCVVEERKKALRSLKDW